MAVKAVAPVAVVPVYNPSMGVEQWRPLIAKYFPANQVDNALRIMAAESGGVPTRDNRGLNRDGSVGYGLMQINSIHADMVNGDLESLRNPDVNVRVAASIYGGRGWCAWSTAPSLNLCD